MTETTPAKPLLTVVAAALVRADGRLLLAQRPKGKSMAGLWELPGGKIETGESPERALSRELREELAIDVAQSDMVPFTFASHAYDDFHLMMPVFLCRKWVGELVPQEGQTLAWATPSDVHGYPAPAADKPLFDAYVNWSGGAA